jgi:hypothetical protein
MNALVFHVLTVLAAAGTPAAPENMLLKELVEKGVAMPDGQVINLPSPMMAEGLNEAQQTAVLTKTATLARAKATLQQFLDPTARLVALKQGKIATKADQGIIRTINAEYVVYGNWDLLTSDEFSKNILKAGKANGGNNIVSKAGYLTPAELAVRGIATRSTSGTKEYVLYTTFSLLDQVELSATRFCVATKTPTGVIIAAKVDPRFDKDKQYPNEWRLITRGAGAVAVMGKPQLYTGGAAFYAKVTRLISPKDAIFVEFHQVFYEPWDWFGSANVNRLPTELATAIPFKMNEFRGKLKLATDEMAKKPEKKPEK